MFITLHFVLENKGMRVPISFVFIVFLILFSHTDISLSGVKRLKPKFTGSNSQNNFSNSLTLPARFLYSRNCPTQLKRTRAGQAV